MNTNLSNIFLNLLFKIVKEFKGHDAFIHQILPFSAHLVSIDESNVVKVWEIDSTGRFLN
jgi:hypothetical protein